MKHTHLCMKQQQPKLTWHACFLKKKGQSIASRSSRGTVCSVVAGYWARLSANRKQMTSSLHWRTLGRSDLCASGRDVCVYRFVFWEHGILLLRVCARLRLLFFGLFSYLIVCMNPSGSGGICVFIWRLLCVCVCLCACVFGCPKRIWKEPWTEAQHVLNTSLQTAYVGIVCVVYDTADHPNALHTNPMARI